MTNRQIIAILTAILRAKDTSLDGDAAVISAIALARGGMGEAELVDALAMIVIVTTKSFTEGGDPGAEIVRDVDFALALRGAAACWEEENRMALKRNSMSEEIKYELLPEHLRGGMRRYIEQGVPPGQFLQAVLRNDFAEAVVAADDANLAAILGIARFMHNEVPRSVWGSRETVDAWLAKWADLERRREAIRAGKGDPGPEREL
jgi:hypothetical protein